jgi:hypothetical protein
MITPAARLLLLVLLFGLAGCGARSSDAVDATTVPGSDAVEAADPGAPEAAAPLDATPEGVPDVESSEALFDDPAGLPEDSDPEAWAPDTAAPELPEGPDVPADAPADAPTEAGSDVPPPPPCDPGTWILQGFAPNARDLGGLALRHGGTTLCGTLFRGAKLDGLSEAGCAAFHDLGVRTVLDLRTDAERLSAPDAACVQADADVLPAPLPIPYSLSADDYLADLHALDTMTIVFDALTDPAAYPVYFHCLYGRDRTGVVAAVVLLALGVERADVLAEYELTADAGLTVVPASLEAVLDELAPPGALEAYLQGVGVTPQRLALLRSMLTAP